MFENGFEPVRDFLLTHSKASCRTTPASRSAPSIRRNGRLRFFGTYAGPIDIFKQYFQPQLQGLYQQSNPAPLEFGIGYRWSPRQSTLIVATRRGTEVSPLQTEPPRRIRPQPAAP